MSVERRVEAGEFLELEYLGVGHWQGVVLQHCQMRVEDLPVKGVKRALESAAAAEEKTTPVTARRVARQPNPQRPDDMAMDGISVLSD